MFNKVPASRDKSHEIPASLNTALLHTIVAVTTLRDVLARETEALKNTNSREFLDLQDEKVEAARHYESLYNNIVNRPLDEIKTADPKLKEQLLRLEDDVRKTMKANVQAIKRMENATVQLGERIMKSARKTAESMTQFAYGASGMMQKGNKAIIGVDERA